MLVDARSRRPGPAAERRSCPFEPRRTSRRRRPHILTLQERCSYGRRPQVEVDRFELALVGADAKELLEPPVVVEDLVVDGRLAKGLAPPRAVARAARYLGDDDPKRRAVRVPAAAAPWRSRGVRGRSASRPRRRRDPSPRNIQQGRGVAATRLRGTFSKAAASLAATHQMKICAGAFPDT